MSKDLKHIKVVVGLGLKGVLLCYFACFFMGKNVVNNLFSFEKTDYELYEEMESQDAEGEEEVDDKEVENEGEFREYISPQLNTDRFFSIQLGVWNKGLNYEGFQREIPDPPPQV